MIKWIKFICYLIHYGWNLMKLVWHAGRVWGIVSFEGIEDWRN